MVLRSDTRPAVRWRQGARRVAGSFLSLLLLSAGIVHGSEENPEKEEEMSQARQELPTGQPMALAGGASREHPFDLEAGEFIHLVAEQQGIDVVVRLVDPAGQPLLVVDTPNGTDGPERVEAVAETTGRHRLVVSSLAATAGAGHYELRVEERGRPATDVQRRRAAAARIFSEAEQLRRERRVPTRRQALLEYRRAFEIWTEVDDVERQAAALHRIGWIEDQLGEASRALAASERAAELFRRLDDRRMLATSLNRVGLLRSRLGDAGGAIEAHREALALGRELGHLRIESAAINNLGRIYRHRNEIQTALEHYRRAEGLVAGKDAHMESIAALNIGELLLQQDRLAEARDALERSLDLARRHDYLGPQAQALLRLGDVAMRSGELDTAESRLEEALALQRAHGNAADQAASLNSLANVYRARDRIDVALAKASAALALLEGAPSELRAIVLLNVGRLQFARGEHAGALDSYAEARKISSRLGDDRGSAASHFGTAQVLHARGELDDARRHLELAVDQVETVRSATASPEMRSSFFAVKQDYYDLLIDVWMHLAEEARPEDREVARDYAARALQVSERRRARSLLDLLLESGSELGDETSEKLVRRERDLQGRLNALEVELRRARDEQARQSAAEQAGNRVAALEKRQRALLQILLEVRATLRSESPRYAGLTQPEPLDLQGIRRQVLDDASLLLVYALGEERSFLWCVTRDRMTSHVLPRREQLEKVAGEAYDSLVSNHPLAVDRRQSRLRLLSQVLLGPVAGELGDRRLLVVAEGSLQLVPFGVLPDPAVPAGGEASRRPLVQSHEIVYLPSATVLAAVRREVADRAPAPRMMAIVADPVFGKNDERYPKERPAGVEDPEAAPAGEEATRGAGESADLERAARDLGLEGFYRLVYSGDEAEAIARLLPEAPYSLEGFDANRENVTGDALGFFRYLHFATHGILNRRHPELSGLLLSLVDRRGRPQNGLLLAHEIYNLYLPAELAVLSACQTGLGTDVRGEGLVGLMRAFMYAGVPRLVVSLWNVSDRSTAELMERFYFGLVRHDLTPAAALRCAQLSMLEEEEWRDPRLWGAFVAQGEWRTAGLGGSGDGSIEEEDPAAGGAGGGYIDMPIGGEGEPGQPGRSACAETQVAWREYKASPPSPPAPEDEPQGLGAGGSIEEEDPAAGGAGGGYIDMPIDGDGSDPDDEENETRGREESRHET